MKPHRITLAAAGSCLCIPEATGLSLQAQGLVHRQPGRPAELTALAAKATHNFGLRGWQVSSKHKQMYQNRSLVSKEENRILQADFTQ